MKNYTQMKEINTVEKEYGIDFSTIHGCELCHFESGEVIISQGTLIESLYVVIRGKIKVGMLAGNGKDLTLCYYISSGILGDAEFVQEDKSASATAIAAVSSDCMKIPLSHNIENLLENIIFMNQVAKGLSTKLLNSSNAHISSALYSGEERLCSYILMAEHKDIFTDVLTDVAKSIGISYRHLFRILKEMCENGVLERRESGFVILDKQYLLKKGMRL